MKTLVKLFAVATFLAVFSFGQTASAEHGEVLKNWYTKDNKSKVQIYKCGDMVCGKFVWLKEPLTEEGKPKTDKNNEDATRQDKPIIGLIMLKDFVEDAQTEHAWTNGTIYDPENGKTYSANMTLNEDGTLDVRGYIGMPLFGRSQEWVKAD